MEKEKVNKMILENKGLTADSISFKENAKGMWQAEMKAYGENAKEIQKKLKEMTTVIKEMKTLLRGDEK